MTIPTFSKMVLFGDSDTDGGADAHGVYTLNEGAWPAAPYVGGRFCNGPVWPEYLAPKLGIVYNPKDNYAVGGATTGSSNCIKKELFQDTGILRQVQAYVRAHPQAEPDTLFFAWGGGANFLEPDAGTPETVERAMRDLAEIVTLLGATNAQTIVLATLVNLALCPERRGDSATPHFQQLFDEFNVRLVRMVRQLQARHPSRLLLVDIAGFVQEVVANSVAFGFANTTDGCLVDGVVCAEPNHYLFWDGGHFSAAFQPLLAERFYQTILKEIAEVKNVQ